MLISTDIGAFMKYGSVKQVLELIKNAGFDAYDFSFFNNDAAKDYLYADNYLENARDLRKFADEIGLICNQTHAVFPAVRLGDDEYNIKMFNDTVKCLEASSVLGAKICVVHPCNYGSLETNAEENAEFYLRLLPFAQEYDIKIALENMFQRVGEDRHLSDATCSHHNDFKRHLDLLPEKYFVACVDVGHANLKCLKTSPAEMIRCLGNRVCALHLHDNDTITDSHLLPYTVSVDFNEIVSALKDINYRGDITLEAVSYPSLFPTSVYPEVAELMCAITKYIRSRVIEDE